MFVIIISNSVGLESRSVHGSAGNSRGFGISGIHGIVGVLPAFIALHYIFLVKQLS